MAFTKTLDEFKTRVKKLADIDGQVGTGSTFRHPTTWVDEVADSSYRRLRECATKKGFKHFLVGTNIASLPTTGASDGAGGTESFATVTFPAGALFLKGVDVKQSGYWRRLRKQAFGERRDRQDQSGVVDNPHSWYPTSHGSVATTVFTDGTIAIYPVPTEGEYRIWYLPDWTDIAGNDTYLFLYDNQAWYDYHVYYAVLEICGVRDNDTKGRAKWAADMLAKAEAEMGELVEELGSDGPESWTRDEYYHGGARGFGGFGGLL